MLCSKVNMKINALSRLNRYISRDQALLIRNVVLLSNFNYCPLMWLFSNKGANKEINRIHTSVPRVPYEDYEFPLEILLTRSGNACIHMKNLQTLMIEIYTSINHLSQSLVRKFHEKECVENNLSLCKLPTIRSTSFGWNHCLLG